MPVQMNRHVDVALLASNAAMELDELMDGTGTNLRDVHELLRVLPNLLEPADVNAPSSFDPAAVSMVSQAYDDANWASIRTIDELEKETKSLADKLRLALAQNSNTEFIRSFRTFCLALSGTAASCGPSFEDLDPTQQLKF